MSTEIAKTILEQLGGRKFTVMTGAKNFIAWDKAHEVLHNAKGGE